jgi:DNA-binding CsgD family transcriptional regulator
MEALLERERELAEIEAMLGTLKSGTGALVLVEGEPGIGKTALLRRAIALAEERGVDVLRARGGELERELTFGIARQLLERRASSDGLLDGAARHAAPVLSGESAADLDEPSLVHALFWACANLAERGPLLVVVDDTQWADPASLRFLVYLARRVEELPVAVVASISTGEPDAPGDLLRALGTVPGMRRLELPPLSPAAAETLARTELGDPDPAVLRVVHEAGAGNPLLVREAAATLAREPHAEPALRPQAVGRSVLRRLERLPPSAAALARAVAVLGPDATLAHAAVLADAGPEEAAAAADQLAEARILDGRRPLAFTHPLVRSTLLASLGQGERSRAHAHAARLLHAAGAGAPRVVAHLLAAEPAGDPETVRLLRAAAAAEPDPRRAATALRRALDEPPAAGERGTVLLELGEAEARAYEPEAIAHLSEARALAADDARRLEATRALARAWTLAPEPDAALAWVHDELGELGDDPQERDVRLALRALEVIRGRVTSQQARALREEAGAAATAAERYLLAALAYKATDHGTAEDACDLAELALGGGLHAEGIRGSGAILVLAALETADALERADRVALDALALAREHGDVSGSALALTVHADVAARRGALADAEAESREALALADEHGLAWAQPVAIATLIEALGEQGRGDEADAVLAERELTSWQQGSARAAVHLHARARLRLAQGRHEEALADFQAAGGVMQRYGVDHPAVQGWRSGAAEALLALGRGDAALPLADEEAALARPFGAAHPLGAALRVAGLAAGGDLDRLREAVDVLEHSPARLARARALVDLGAALRRGGERAAAREPLRLGLDLAHACGATALTDRAQQELEASGARPRRRAISGVEALTPSERRVAEMAASGLSNRDIAQALFLSVRTIENQLRQVYLKLDIGSRKEIADALAAS